MQECDSFSLRSNPRFLVDKLNSRGAAAVESRVEIVHRKANVMNPRSALLEKLREPVVALRRDQLEGGLAASDGKERRLRLLRLLGLTREGRG